MTTEKNIATDILNIPEREFGPAPWWAWMDDPTPASIDRDLQNFLALEVYEIIIIPLYGLRPEYMGEEYLELWRHTCRRCRQWGLKLWIYDEFNWPSGTCAGKVLRDYPEYSQHFIQFTHPDNYTNRGDLPTWEIVKGTNFQLAAHGSEWSCGANGYLDTLNADAVSVYIKMTHEEYKRAAGEYFQDVILGFFTDEPVMTKGVDLPWTPALFDLFDKKYGYDLRPLVPLLAADAPDAARIRYDYWTLTSELFQNNFFKQYADWCSKHGLQMTGHLLHEELLTSAVGRNGNVYAVLSEMQVPGIDLLRGVTSFDCGQIIAVDQSSNRDIAGKIIESVAYFGNKKRSLCEAFGCMPHHATFSDYMRAADFLFHHGISMINDNLFSDSMSSFRKFCGCHSFLTPWAKYYHLFARHIRSMSFLNSESRLLTSTGLYYPGADARARYLPPLSLRAAPYFYDTEWDLTEQTLNELVHGLLRRHWDYYLVFDQMLQSGTASENGLKMRQFDCQVLIFPNIHYIDSATAPALRQFVKSGGVMLCVGRIPQILTEKDETQTGEWGPPAQVILLKTPVSRITCEVVRVLQSLLQPSVTLSGPGASDVMATHRLTNAGEILFLSNFGLRTADIDVSIPGKWQRIDTIANQAAGLLTNKQCLLPSESRLFQRIPEGSQSGSATFASQKLFKSFDNKWDLSLPDGNVVALPFSLFEGESTALPPADPDAGWSALFTETAPRDLIPEQSYWLRREIIVAHEPHRLELIVDGVDGCEVFVNRRQLPTQTAPQPIWDYKNQVCDIRGSLRKGANEILIRYTPARARRFVKFIAPYNDMPVFLLRGDFLLLGKPGIPAMIPVLSPLPGEVETGALQPRGYPHFIGVAEYSQCLSLDHLPQEVILDMGPQNDLFEIEVNGQIAGVPGCPPYRVKIGSFLKEGVNRFVFRLHTALGGGISRFFAGMPANKPPIGMLTTPVLYEVSEENMKLS